MSHIKPVFMAAHSPRWERILYFVFIMRLPLFQGNPPVLSAYRMLHSFHAGPQELALLFVMLQKVVPLSVRAARLYCGVASCKRFCL